MSASSNTGATPHIHPKDRLLKLPSVMSRVEISRAGVYRLVANGDFPKPMKLGTSSLWSEMAVNQWIEDFKEKAGCES